MRTDPVLARCCRLVLAPILCILWSLAGCGSYEDLDEVEKAKLISKYRKQAEEQLAIFARSSEDPGGVDVDALQKYVDLHGETTKIAPGTCPLCYANYAEALSRLGLYYDGLVRALEREKEGAADDEKADLDRRIEKATASRLEAFSNSNRQFRNYFDLCERINQPIDSNRYYWALRNSEFLKDYQNALRYLEQYVANVVLSDSQQKEAEKLRLSYQRELRKLEETRLRDELEKSSR